VYEVLQRLHVRPGEAGDEHLSSLYSLTHLPLFMDLTIPHLLAYLLSISCETHRNVHTGFPFLKLRLWLELLAFKVSEYCCAVACAISIGTGLVEAAERLLRQTFLYGVHGKMVFMARRRSLASERVITSLKYDTLSIHRHSYVQNMAVVVVA